MGLIEIVEAYVGAMGIYVIIFVVALLVILLPLSAYSTQKWAYKNYLETKSVNAKLSEILELARLARSQEEQQPADEWLDSGKKRREPTIGNDLDIPLD